MNCPSCHREIPAANINAKTDVTHCLNCNKKMKTSTFLAKANKEKIHLDLSNPPKGVFLDKKLDSLKIEISLRIPFAFFLIPFLLLWSGYSLNNFYLSQIIERRFDSLQTIVGIPFLLVAAICWQKLLMATLGKQIIRLRATEGEIFKGVGKLGSTKCFELKDIKSVREEEFHGYKQIVLECKKNIVFGASFDAVQRNYIREVLQQFIEEKIKQTKNDLEIDLSRHLIN